MKPFRINVGDRCLNGCYFCASRGRSFHTSPAYIARKLTDARARGCDSAVFAGLGPASHPDFPGFVAVARRLGFEKISVETIAIPFADASLAGRSAALGLDSASVLFISGDAASYDDIARAPGAFTAFLKGVKNISATRRISIDARIPVCGKNFQRISEISSFALSLGAKSINIIFPVNYFFEDAYLDVSLLEKEIEKASAAAAGAGASFHFERSSKFFRYAAESQERAAPAFYPTFYVGRNAKPEVLEALIRPTFACNQICKFCYVDCSQKSPPQKTVETEIRRVIRKRIPKLAFSGGEPTLDPRLPDYIALAKNGGVRQVEIHTNAVRLADPALCRRLAAAGLDLAFCTLLAPDAALSDSITRTAGTFRKTVAGIQNLLIQGTHAAAHFVIMEDNYRTLPDFVRFCDKTFSSGKEKLPITFSYVAPRDAAATRDGIVPRYPDALPFLRAALAECSARGIPYCAGEGLKGVPPCVLPEREGYLRQLLPQARNVPQYAFVKKDCCAHCRANDTCFGVRRFYAEYYGLDEINPIE